MSVAEEEMRKYNTTQAEERRKAEAEHMAEMALKIAAVKKVVIVEPPDNSVQGAWRKRAAWWAQVLAAMQQKK